MCLYHWLPIGWHSSARRWHKILADQTCVQRSSRHLEFAPSARWYFRLTCYFVSGSVISFSPNSEELFTFQSRCACRSISSCIPSRWQALSSWWRSWVQDSCGWNRCSDTRRHILECSVWETKVLGWGKPTLAFSTNGPPRQALRTRVPVQ